MDFRLFFKNKFLRKTFGDFVNTINNGDYSTFKSTLVKNSSWYVPASLFNKEDKVIQKLFNSIDGSSLKNGNSDSFEYGTKNSKLESQELYDWVRYNYKHFTGKDISNEELYNMKMSEFMNKVEDFLNNGFELK